MPRLQRDPEGERADRPYGACYLFSDWSGIRRRLHAAKFVALFTDFDGTVVPIQARSDRVHLSLAGRQLLARLACHPRIRLWIVTGRRLADIRRRTRGVGAHLAGLHGWERKHNVPQPGPAQETLRQVAGLLHSRLRGLHGVRIEDKKWALSIHYRAAGKPEVRRARAVLREVLKRFNPGLRLLPGKMVWEIIPCQIVSRGEAVRNLLAEAPQGALAVYIGDDSSDESAFRALRQGITVHVGAGDSTRAQYYLRSPQEVLIFLGKIEREVT